MIVFNYVRENLEDDEHRVCKLPVNFPEFDKDIQDTLIAQLIGPDPKDTPWRKTEMLGCAWRRMYRRSWYLANELTFYNEQEIMLEDLPATLTAHLCARRMLVVGGAYYHYRYNPQSLSTKYRPGKMEMLVGCFNVVRGLLKEWKLYEKYNERHLAWLLRSAAHSSFINCFSPMNPAGFSARYREVRAILHHPLVRQAAQSDYLKSGTKADKLILRMIRTQNTPIVYLFYRFYSHILMKDARRK